MKRCILNLLLLLQLTLIFAQSDNTDQTGISVDQYKKLQSLDPRPDPSRRWMDTLMFPAKEAATGVLAATKMRTVYLVGDVPSLLQIPAPPANSSAQTAAELKYLLELQSARTEEEIRRYKKLAGIFHSPNNFNPFDPDYDRNFSSLFHIGSPLGEWYTYKNLPVTAGFLSDVYRDATYYFFKLKFLFNRARPYMLESKIKYLERPPHPSYPSGHSAASYVNAYIMMRVDPTLTSDFLKMAAEMAYSREVIGVHYPSDSEAGKVWALRFVEELFKTEKFQQDFNKARAEILEWKSKNKSSALEQEKQCSSSCSSCSSICNESCSAASSCCNQ